MVVQAVIIPVVRGGAAVAKIAGRAAVRGAQAGVRASAKSAQIGVRNSIRGAQNEARNTPKGGGMLRRSISKRSRRISLRGSAQSDGGGEEKRDWALLGLLGGFIAIKELLDPFLEVAIVAGLGLGAATGVATLGLGALAGLALAGTFWMIKFLLGFVVFTLKLAYKLKNPKNIFTSILLSSGAFFLELIPIPFFAVFPWQGAAFVVDEFILSAPGKGKAGVVKNIMRVAKMTPVGRVVGLFAPI